MIRILVDSAADYQMEEIKEKDLEMVPLTVTVGQENYQDTREMERGRLYEILAEGKETVRTSQPSPQDFLDVFEGAKEKKEELICILLSSALSGTYQSASIAKEMVEYEHIYLVDSLTATIAVKVLADYALEKVKEGMSAKEIVSGLEQLKGKVHIWAALDTLKYLYMGGRISKTAAVLGEAANVKPVIELTKEGTVGVAGKYLGIGRTIKETVKHLQSVELNPEFPLYVIYSSGEANAEKLEKHLQEAQIAVSGRQQIGAVIGVHVGPGAFGVIYVEK